MANPYFRFKQFTIWHDKCAMKVGTDAVLLGSWVNIENRLKILDIGTGSGIIALMLAQRSKGNIDAIDIDPGACAQAEENAISSPFGPRIRIIHSDLAQYAQDCTTRYDLIVSNPPYFIHSLKCPDPQRNTARHTDSLTLSDLLKDGRKLLAPSGQMALILPYEQTEEARTLAETNGLFRIRQTNILPVRESAPKRLLIEFSTTPCPNPTLNHLVIEETRHQYTEEYRALTRDFYLKM